MHVVWLAIQIVFLSIVGFVGFLLMFLWPFVRLLIEKFIVGLGIGLGIWVAILLMTGDAEASDTRQEWGIPSWDSEPSFVEIVPGGGGTHVASVEFHNRLTKGHGDNSDYIHLTFRVDGQAIEVLIIQRTNDKCVPYCPDFMQITKLPAGLEARPTEVTVDENAIGVIEIHLVPMG